MKKSELEEIIRNVVKEEIINAMPIILTEVANAVSGKKPFLKESASFKINSSTINQPVNQSKRSIPAGKKYSNNPVLNKILNETVGGISNDDPTSRVAFMEEGYETVGGEPSNVGVSLENSLFNKDYSQILKKSKPLH